MDDDFLREKENIRRKMLEFSKGINEGKSVSELVGDDDEMGAGELSHSSSDEIIKKRLEGGAKSPSVKTYLKEDLINVKLEERVPLSARLLAKFKRKKPEKSGIESKKAQENAAIANDKKTAPKANIKAKDDKNSAQSRLKQPKTPLSEAQSAENQVVERLNETQNPQNQKPVSDLEARMRASKRVNRQKLLESSPEPKPQATRISNINFREGYLKDELARENRQSAISSEPKSRLDDMRTKILLKNQPKNEDFSAQNGDLKTRQNERNLSDKSPENQRLKQDLQSPKNQAKEIRPQTRQTRPLREFSPQSQISQEIQPKEQEFKSKDYKPQSRQNQHLQEIQSQNTRQNRYFQESKVQNEWQNRHLQELRPQNTRQIQPLNDENSLNLPNLAIDFDSNKANADKNSSQIKSVLLEGHQHATKAQKNLGVNQLLFAALFVAIALLVFAPKIYITSNIYYLSRDIASLRTQESVLSEENKELSRQLENMRFKNQILDYLE